MNFIQNNFMKSHTNRDIFMSNSSSFMESRRDREPQRVPHSIVQNPNQVSSINEQKIEEIWSKHNFEAKPIMHFGTVRTWGSNETEDNDDNRDFGADDDQSFMQEEENGDADGRPKDNKSPVEEASTEIQPDSEQIAVEQEETSPPHHARRPPNAFLIFCKKHRPIVRQRYPTTENRGVTKILGEWWALLNAGEKQPYNDLAKEYKDAFLSANPGFRWYKLPAPPLRTLTPRPALATTPTTITKPTPTVSASPPVYPSEFTPGKLADESQLGGLTSLMNNNYSIVRRMEDDAPCCRTEDNNNENPDIQQDLQVTKVPDKIQDIFSSPTNLIQPTLPPKPIKKRIFEQYEDEKYCLQNIFNEKIPDGSMTQQDLLNKVVDGIFANEKEVSETKEQRKSDRMCKGKRYERFMVEGKLLGNKRETKLTQHHRISRIESKIEHELTLTKPPQQDPPRLDLENTIKRLAERTNIKIDLSTEETKPKIERERTASETSEGGSGNNANKTPNVNFNLDLRIDNLPSLNYDDFIKRKRDSKKRKPKTKSENVHGKILRLENNNVIHKPEVPPVVGSQKRKNKLSITHLNKPEENLLENKGGLEGDNALLGLATLAMVAANTEKIENIIT